MAFTPEELEIQREISLDHLTDRAEYLKTNPREAPKSVRDNAKLAPGQLKAKHLLEYGRPLQSYREKIIKL